MTAHEPKDATFAEALRRKIDGKTKPVGALGRIEALAAQVARVQGRLAPRMARCRLTIFAADHGIAAEGVSAYPQAVTRQMVLNFLDGNAAANVFARSVGAELRVVDAGVAGEPIADPRLVARRIGPGTRNALREPAMTAAERDRALAEGRALGGDGSFDAVAFGEMGIANTSAATLVAHKLAGLPLALLTGRGTGLDDAGLARKEAVLAAAAAADGAAPRRRHRPRRIRRLRDRDDGGRDARRRRGAPRSSSSTASSPRRPRSSRSRSTRRPPAPSSSPTARPSTATRRSSPISAPSRSSTSGCASARAPARSSPGRWCGRRRRC